MRNLIYIIAILLAQTILFVPTYAQSFEEDYTPIVASSNLDNLKDSLYKKYPVEDAPKEILAFWDNYFLMFKRWAEGDVNEAYLIAKQLCGQLQNRPKFIEKNVYYKCLGQITLIYASVGAPETYDMAMKAKVWREESKSLVGNLCAGVLHSKIKSGENFKKSYQCTKQIIKKLDAIQRIDAYHECLSCESFSDHNICDEKYEIAKDLCVEVEKYIRENNELKQVPEHMLHFLDGGHAYIGEYLAATGKTQDASKWYSKSLDLFFPKGVALHLPVGRYLVGNASCTNFRLHRKS